MGIPNTSANNIFHSIGVLNTRGGGDCAFHAILGQPRVQGTSQPVVACDDVQAERKRVADAVRTCIRNGNRQDPFFILISEVLRDVVTHPEAPASLSRIKEYNEQRVRERGERQAAAERALEAGLRQNREIFNFIEQNSTETNFMARFQACLNLYQGQLRQRIAADNQLNALFTEYTGANSDVNFLEDYLLSTPTAVEEYAQYLERLGNWLLSSELKIIAHVNEISVEVYYGDNYLGTFNPGRNRTVLVRHNGSNHYERLTEQVISNTSEHQLKSASLPVKAVTTPVPVIAVPISAISVSVPAIAVPISAVTVPVPTIEQLSKKAEGLLNSLSTSSLDQVPKKQVATEGIVEVKAKHDKNNNSLVLEIVQSDSKESAVKRRYEKTLFLTPQGKLDTVRNKTVASELVCDMTQDSALLKIPGVEGNIVLQSDGSFVLGKISTEGYLKLSTHGNIVTTAAIDAEKLKLHGKDISIHKQVKTRGLLVLQADGKLNNHHILHAKNMAISGKGRFHNLGLTRADQKLSLGISAVDNSGTVLAKEIDSDPTPLVNEFNNSGVVLGAKSLSIDAGSIINQPGGELLSSNEIILKPQIQFKNDGQVIARETLGIQGHPVAYGSRGDIPLDPRCLVNNNGTFRAKKISTAHLSGFQNQTQGKVYCENSTLQSKNEFLNLGLLAATEKLSISTDASIKNSKTGKIYSNQSVKILGLGAFENQGEVTGHLNVSLNTIGDTLNDVAAKITGSTLTSYAHTFSNNGDILTKLSLGVTAQSVYNGPTGNMGSEGDVNVQSHTTVNNSGKLFGRNLELQAETLINNTSTSQIIAFNDLTLKIKTQIDNAGLILVNENLKVATEVLNNAEGAYLGSCKAADMKVTHLNNQGTIEAGCFLLKVIVNLCNSQAARLAATQTLEILSKSIQNEGGITSEGTALVEATIKLTNTLKGHISAEQWLKLVSVGSIENAAKIISRGDLLIKAVQEFSNLAEGNVLGRNVKIETNVHRNQGSIIAEQKLDIETKYILDNSIRGLILAGEKLNLFSKSVLQNSGDIQSRGTLLLKADDLLKNLQSGQVVAEEDLQLLAGHVLSNAGDILGKKDLLIKSGCWFTNELTGKIHSKGNLSVQADSGASNKGTIYSEGTFSLKGLEIIRNHGIIKADQALNCLSQILTNQGTICSDKTVSIETQMILDNYREGKILANDAIQLCSACFLRNAGTVQSAKDLNAKSEVLLQTLAGSKMEASQKLTVFSNFSIENAGLLLGEQVRVEASQVFSNLMSGQVVATGHLEANAQSVSNEGNLRSYGSLTSRSDMLLNFSSGKISAAGALQFYAKELMDNRGSIVGGSTQIETAKFINTGTIDSAKTLSFKIQNILMACQQGRLSAEEGISAVAGTIHLAGQLITNGKLELKPQQGFDYEPGTLWVCQLMELVLKQGYDFTKPLTVQGSLQVNAENDVRVKTKIETTGDTTITARNLTASSGGIFAGGKLKADIQKLLQVSNGATLASNDTMTLNAMTIRNAQGNIYTAGDLIANALHLFQNSGNIAVNGNANVKAPLFLHTENSSFMVRKSCTIEGRTQVNYADFRIGEKLTTHGEFEYRSRELDAENARRDEERRKAKRKRRKKIVKSLLGTAIGIGISFVLGPAALPALGKTWGPIVAGAVKGAMTGGDRFCYWGRQPH